jgi:hypothetical protein
VIILAAAKLILALLIAATISAAVAVGAWTIIYHGMCCRKHPIEKTLIASVFSLVVICAAVIKVL